MKESSSVQIHKERLGRHNGNICAKNLSPGKGTSVRLVYVLVNEISENKNWGVIEYPLLVQEDGTTWWRYSFKICPGQLFAPKERGFALLIHTYAVYSQYWLLDKLQSYLKSCTNNEMHPVGMTEIKSIDPPPLLRMGRISGGGGYEFTFYYSLHKNSRVTRF